MIGRIEFVIRISKHLRRRQTTKDKVYQQASTDVLVDKNSIFLTMLNH